jgi:chain length determinant protein tyrosine kinase EpsG
MTMARSALSVTAGSVPLKRADRSIGAILIDAGRLKAEAAESILRLQREQGLRFGDAAMKLGLLTQDDIDFAISRQFDYPYLRRGQSAVSEGLIAAYAPFTPQVEALRALRSQLMLRWFDADVSRRALAVVSAERNEGRSFIAANLAIVFSQLGEHTLLVDADMRNPCQHRLFGLDNRAGLSALLTGRGAPDTIQRIPALRDLSVLPAGLQPPNPSELLARPEFAQLLKNDWAAEYDILILDTPAVADTADAQTVARCTGGAMIVARKNASRFARVRGIAENAIQTSATIVGTVLNDF